MLPSPITLWILLYRKRNKITRNWIPSGHRPDQASGPPPGGTTSIHGDRITLQEPHYETFLESTQSLLEYSSNPREYEVPSSSQIPNTPFVDSGCTSPPSYSSINNQDLADDDTYTPPLPPRSPHQLQPSPYSIPVSSHGDSSDSLLESTQDNRSRVYFELESQELKNQPTYFVLETVTAKENPVVETGKINETEI